MEGLLAMPQTAAPGDPAHPSDTWRPTVLLGCPAPSWLRGDSTQAHQEADQGVRTGGEVGGGRNLDVGPQWGVSGQPPLRWGAQGRGPLSILCPSPSTPHPSPQAQGVPRIIWAIILIMPKACCVCTPPSNLLPKTAL